jgi:hypothetical protein
VVWLSGPDRPGHLDLEGKLVERTLPPTEDATHLHYNFISVITFKGVFPSRKYR